ncbi:MAG: hypothetical protein RLO17_24270 [Cyclobacteriaceae bacterium]|jgi:hypothetical protein|tara:strand:- start:1423 stop:2259 length:837 start_codon:yes stop_codon:yes gene_type:complete
MKKILFIALLGLLSISKGKAQGHGPLFGLQTPTLAKGGFDFNAAAMSLATDDDQSFMLRYIWSYGVTEDLQLNITTPTMINRLSEAPRTRGNSNMPANGDIEASVWYRFFSSAFSVGKRFESTAVLSISTPTEKTRGQTNVSNSIHGAISTGYASRTWYAWVGGGYQYYFEEAGDQLGDLPYASLVVGYRPNIFMGDYPKPDWRIFVESLAEFPGSNTFEGQLSPTDQRGKKVMLGPSFLGLYGAWGISFGALFPAYQNVNEGPKEKYRLSMNISYWL